MAGGLLEVCWRWRRAAYVQSTGEPTTQSMRESRMFWCERATGAWGDSTKQWLRASLTSVRSSHRVVAHGER
jgi:hypothetical protein